MNKSRASGVCVVGDFIFLKYCIAETERKYGAEADNLKIPTLELYGL